MCEPCLLFVEKEASVLCVVSGFYEALYLWCKIGVMNFAVASWNVFLGRFGYNVVELCSDRSVCCFCHISRV